MSKYPLKIRESLTPQTKIDAVERAPSFPFANPFFSFSFSYTEITAINGKTLVKSTETRFEDGKITSREFDGTAGPELYNQMAAEAQNYFMNQTAFFLKQLSLFLPMFSGKARDREQE